MWDIMTKIMPELEPFKVNLETNRLHYERLHEEGSVAAASHASSATSPPVVASGGADTETNGASVAPTASRAKSLHMRTQSLSPVTEGVIAPDSKAGLLHTSSA
jgi:hypothetical protein